MIIIIARDNVRANLCRALSWPTSPPPHSVNLQTKNLRLRISGESPVGLGIPPLRIKSLLEPHPPKSRYIIIAISNNSYEYIIIAIVETPVRLQRGAILKNPKKTLCVISDKL